RIGKGSEKYVMVIKRMEMMGFDPRVGGRAWHLGHITSVRGGDNVRSTHFGFLLGEYRQGEDSRLVEWLDMPVEVKKAVFGEPYRIDQHSYEGKVMLTKWLEDLTTAINALGMCLFASSNAGLGPTDLSKLYSACTGWEMKPSDLLSAGERIFNLQRAFNVREGITRDHDRWPDRFYEEEVPDGPSKGSVLKRNKIEEVLGEYYRLRGWDELGIPTKERLITLGLEDVAADFKARGIIKGVHR
ncbi:MAG: aldehyde ferredoxin oxidoreductase C-terminal domain-containing protein, partial [Nitrososphaerota archaeon]